MNSHKKRQRKGLLFIRLITKMNQQKIANIGLIIALVAAACLIGFYRHGENKRWTDLNVVEETTVQDVVID